MVDKILEELKCKLKEIASCSKDSYVSIGLSTQFATVNNIVKADEILISEEEISIESDNFELNFSYGCVDYGCDEYYFANDDMNLCVCLLGT